MKSVAGSAELVHVRPAGHGFESQGAAVKGKQEQGVFLSSAFQKRLMKQELFGREVRTRFALVVLPFARVGSFLDLKAMSSCF